MPGLQMPPAWAVPPLAAPPTSSTLAQPPDGLDPVGAKFWTDWAPWAIEQGTLIDATVAGFRELCEQMVVKAALWKRLSELGIATAEGDRILKRYEKIVQRVDSSLARFRLTSFGKAHDQSGKKKADPVNPWAGLARKA